MSALATLISFDAALLVAGIIAFYLGIEALVEGASRLVIGLGLRTAIVGMTIVAFTTITPELPIAVLNSLGYNSDLGLGAIVDLNIASIGLVLGILALVEPMGVSTATLRRHVPFMVATTVVLVALGMDGNLGAADGGILLLILIASTDYLLYRTRSATTDAIGADEIDIKDEDEVSAQFKDVVYLAPGLLLLFVGSNWLAQGGQRLFESFGFGPQFIGLAVLMFGTSLPKLVASVISAIRSELELNTSDVIGSNVYNVIAVSDILAIMVPVDVPPSTISLNFPAFLVFAFGVIALMLCSHNVSRPDGGILVIGYFVFSWLILP